MEPWDGPASIAFTDGTADRRRARPQRPAPLPLLRHQGRPGDHGLRGRRARRPARERRAARAACSPAACSWSTPRRAASSPTRRSSSTIATAAARTAQWLDEQPASRSTTCPDAPAAAEPDHETAAAAPAGLRLHLRGPAHAPRADGAATASSRSARWATTRRWPCSPNKPQLLYNYFKQLFAQVTNPPLDCIREEIDHLDRDARSARSGNLLEPQPEHCRQLELKSPILTNEELAKLRHIDRPGFKRRHAADPVHAAERRRRAWSRRWTSCCRRRDQAIADDASTSSSSPTAASTASTRRSRRCWPSPACTTT